MELEPTEVQVSLEATAPEEAETAKPEVKAKAKKPKKTPKLQQKTAILQVPDNTPQEYLDSVQEHLDNFVKNLGLDGSEIRKLKPDKGGKPKKYLTEEDEKEHYRKYFYDYYHDKLTKEGTCPHCSKSFKTFTSINRHVKNSKACLLIRLQREKEELAKAAATAPEEINEIQEITINTT
jgi:hypothetical protein